MWGQLIESLKDPHLVAEIQKFFGVEIHYNEKFEAKKKKVERKRSSQSNKKEEEINNSVNITKTDLNGHLREKTSTYEQSSKDDEFVEKEILEKEKDYSSSDGEVTSASDSEPNKFTIKNYFWYYLFLFSTELGDEIFYISFIPFWFWNVDGIVGRKVILAWATIMTVGQVMKDVICWPRPACPPAVRLQNKWAQEYGMPSTHAMIGVSIPFGVLFFTMNRYAYSFPLGFTIATIWCLSVCTSRLYLGMHTLLDLIVGLALAIGMMIPLVPLIEATDHYFLSNGWVLLTLIAITISIVIYYPRSDRWTPTRGDTTMIVAVLAGVHAGAWLNYTTGAYSAPLLPPPYSIIWPSYPELGLIVLRIILGFISVMTTKAISKSLIYATMCAILKVNSKELIKSEHSSENKNKVLVDLVYKYIMPFICGFNIVYLLPNLFTIVGIDRPTYYTEM